MHPERVYHALLFTGPDDLRWFCNNQLKPSLHSSPTTTTTPKTKTKRKKEVKNALPLAHDAGYTQVGGSTCHETRVYMQAANTLYI